MAVYGTTLMQGALTMQSPATINGAAFVGATTCSSTLNIAGNTTCMSNLNVAGTLTGNVINTPNLSITNLTGFSSVMKGGIYSMYSSGAGPLTWSVDNNGNENLSGNVSCVGILAVGGNSTHIGAATCMSNLNVAGNFTVAGSQTILGGTVTTSPQTMSSTLTLSGATTCMSTLNIVGQTQMNNNLIVSNGGIYAEGSPIQVWVGGASTGSVFNADTSGNVWNYGNHTVLSSLNVIGSTTLQGNYGCWAQAPIYGVSYASGALLTWGAMNTSNGVTHTANSTSFKLSQSGTYFIGAAVMSTVTLGSAGQIAQLLILTSTDNSTWTQFGSGCAAGPLAVNTPLTTNNIVTMPLPNYYVSISMYSTVGSVTLHSSGLISYIYIYRIG
jgi:hypothetical protein